jgi:hypothetical protein
MMNGIVLLITDMKRYFFLFLCIFSISTVAAQDMAAFFIRMPDSFLPQLDEVGRKDLVGLYQSGKPAVLENTMSGTSTLQKLTADYLFLQSTERSTVEIRLLPLINNTFIACVISTVYAPVADSRVEFYSTEWQPLPASDLWTPAHVYGFLKEDLDHEDDNFLEALSYLDMELIHYFLDPEKFVLEAAFTTPDYLSSLEREKVKPFLKDTSKVYNWRAGRFEENP